MAVRALDGARRPDGRNAPADGEAAAVVRDLGRAAGADGVSPRTSPLQHDPFWELLAWLERLTARGKGRAKPLRKPHEKTPIS